MMLAPTNVIGLPRVRSTVPTVRLIQKSQNVLKFLSFYVYLYIFKDYRHPKSVFCGRLCIFLALNLWKASTLYVTAFPSSLYIHVLAWILLLNQDINSIIYSLHIFEDMGFHCEEKDSIHLQPCAAWRMLRRRCDSKCVLAPYFPTNEVDKFAGVHRVFGASNVIKMIQVGYIQLPIQLIIYIYPMHPFWS